MERLTIDQALIDELRAEVQGFYPDHSEPVPDSYLKLDDDVQIWGYADVRVLWGSDSPGQFAGYAPSGDFGERYALFPIDQVTDRAPVNPEETPMPVMPPETEPEPTQ